MNQGGDTILDTFLQISTNADTEEKDVVNCAGESWSYAELHRISSRLASVIGQQYGPHPTMAVICENHPYLIALFLAVWKLGGVVAPLDRHAPSELMHAMLSNITPTFVVIPAMDLHNRNLVQSLNIPIELVDPRDNTITALTQRFTHLSADLAPNLYDPPQPETIALYIYTSSASSVHNLKCVPVMHGNLVANGDSQLKWLREHVPGISLESLRVLGWSPFSHIMSYCFDLVASAFRTGGCYIFALTPSNYHVAPSSAIDSPSVYDIPIQLLEAILEHEPDIFAGVPWIYEGLFAAWKSEPDSSRRDRIIATLRKFKCLISAGAATSDECLAWAKEYEIPMFIVIGMTELQGALFFSPVRDIALGWDISGSCVRDATFKLVDEKEDVVDAEGELCVSSRLISKGYLNYDNSVFTDNGQGLITFRTGDIYMRTSDSRRLIWKGRKDDFIQLISGESLDPRVVEKKLNGCTIIAHSCVVGNKFSSGPSDFVCALIELTPDGAADMDSSVVQISKAVAAVNKNLPPPLRIAWPRVLILDQDQHIPYTKKMTIFRKKLQALFESRLLEFLGKSHNVEKPSSQSPSTPKQAVDTSAIANVVLDTVSSVLGIPAAVLQANPESTFAELGMDSAMATRIVNSLNKTLHLFLPPNTCHTYTDMKALTAFICEVAIHGSTIRPQHPSLINNTIDKPYVNEPIAIVGQSMRLPGDICTLESLWKALIERRTDVLVPTPSDRWEHRSFQGYSSSGCEITFEKSGFIDIATYDNAFFGIPSAEALSVSPTTRLVLETAFEALENANIPISKVKGTNMGVFVAAGLDMGYNELLQLEKGYGAFDRYYGTGVSTSTAPGRLSYLLDIHGPSLTVETACSGGLVALDQAVRHLQSGRGESAIVSGVNTHTFPGMFGFLSAQHMTSTSSRCATFTKDADGYATSEGAVSIIIKTKSAALRDGDNILGIITATDTMHNGRTQGLVAPNSKVQSALQRSLLKLGSLNPSDIDFLEAHGTGTSLGDLIEIQGINDVFHNSHTESRPLIIGAAKTCIGHTETTSGLVGLVKTLLSFAKGAVPGLTHMTETNINPAIDSSVVPIRIPWDTVKLEPRNEVPLRALVVAYGFAGTNAGAVVESPPITKDHAITLPASQFIPMIFIVSAKTYVALQAYIRSYLDFCMKAPETAFRSICYTSCVGREHYRHKFACVVTDMQDLILKLKNRLSSKKQAAILSGSQLILGFPGQGSQFCGMAKDLAERFSGFRTILAEYARLATQFAGYPVLPLLIGTENRDEKIDQSQVAQLCIFVYQCAMVKWLESLGIRGQAVIGHSFGEIAAVVASGGIDYVDGLKFVIARADALKADISNPGAMVAVNASESVILEYIKKLDVAAHVVIAVFNGEDSHVVSGSEFAVDLVYSAAKTDGIKCTKLRIDQGFHSPCIRESLPKLENWLKNNESIFKPLQTPLYSTVLAEKILPNQRLLSDYWVEHAKSPVKFSQTITAFRHDSLNVFFDIGPQPTMWTALQNFSIPDKITIAATSKRGKDQHLSFLEAIARLLEANVFVDLDQIYGQRGETIPKTIIPTYPFQRQRHYPTYVYSRKTSLQSLSQINQFTPTTVQLLSTDQLLLDLLRDHRIEGRKVLPGVAFADLLATTSYNSAKYVENVRFHQPLVLEAPGILVEASFASNGSFEVFSKTPAGDRSRICSGSLAATPKTTPPVRAVWQDGPPIKVVNREQLYQSFENIYFGPTFRNVIQVVVRSDHIDASIRITPTQNPNLDRIRLLDPCLHMPSVADCLDVDDSLWGEGFYLPTSVDGFELHTETLPSELMCRYYLPFTSTNHDRNISASFDVFSTTGQLLVACRNYAMAWLPKGIAIQAPTTNVSSDHWLINTWRQEENPLPVSPKPLLRHDTTVVYASRTFNKPIITPFVADASKLIFMELHSSEIRAFKISPNDMNHSSSFGNADPEVLGELSGKVLFVLDATDYAVPGSDAFSSFWRHVLKLMRLSMKSGIHMTGFIVVSFVASPTTSPDEITPPSIGSTTQGILKVFGRELGLAFDAVWGIDLPNDLPRHLLSDIISREIIIRNNDGEGCSSITVYQRKKGAKDDSVTRLVPVLVPAKNAPAETSLSDIAVIVGMGSIGSEMASYFLKAGCTGVVFIGRRAKDDSTVLEELDSLKGRSPGIIEYLPCDVTDLPSVRRTFQIIQAQFGSIRNVIHTGGVVKDSTLYNVTEQEFEQVLSPKVLGAWNLHLVSEEMGLALDNFVLTSSISVPLGNPGQAAYVAGNAFMDTLAAYRQSRGLRGVSLQLGAWQSHLVANLDPTDDLIGVLSHERGMPLIMKALTSSEPVQVIANLNLTRLADHPVLGKDPIYRELFVGLSGNSSGRSELTHSKTAVAATIIEVLRDTLELGPEDELDLEESLTSCGADSIAFARVRGRVRQAIGVDIPIAYLSDVYSINDMISSVCSNL